jgi:bifunctional UDP-N-acetylglucosamine pyrophosphorylase / glucosamine-1-phosphate N-acetyltransferase
MHEVVHVAVLAAGEGKRLGGSVPKVLTPLWGRPAVMWPISAARSLQAERVVVVGGANLAEIEKACTKSDSGLRFARQEQPRGTGDALLAAAPALAGAAGSLVVLYGDCPLTTPEMLAALLEHHRRSVAALTVLTVTLPDPSGYGRVLRDAQGHLRAIVEEREADAATRAVREINTGTWVIELPQALEDLRAVSQRHEKGEAYLTDLVQVARERGRTVAALAWPEAEQGLGFNTPRELAQVRAVLRRRIVERHLAAGVEIVDPDSTFIDADVAIEAGARILPCTVIEGDCRIAAGCEVGPFSHLRTGTVLQAGAEVGNFTETKKTVLGPGTKAKHLSYLGDATIGAGANIGAGTITANYDGKAKHATVVGDRAFIGSGTVLVAPVTVGDGALTGAGAIVTRGSRVGPGETWVGVPARPLTRKKEA